MVMGPTAGVVLADLGADVIKVEPVGGDHTRTLLGSGAGYFPMFNRNKRSICLDLKSPDGLIAARRLIDGADRSEEHTSELQSLMRISYAVFCLKKKQKKPITATTTKY